MQSEASNDKTDVAAESKPKHHCDLCGRNYGAVKHLRFHYKKKHPEMPLPKDDSVRGRICFVAGCSIKLTDKFAMLSHVAQHHKDVPIETKNFSSLEEFQTWKSSEQDRTLVRFVKLNKSYKRKDGWVNCSYVCHGAEDSRHGRKELRHLKFSVAREAEVPCPAIMIVSKNPFGNAVIANVVHYHVGHVVHAGPPVASTSSAPQLPKLDILKADHSGNVSIDLGFTKKLLEADLSAIMNWIRERQIPPDAPVVMLNPPEAITEVTCCTSNTTESPPAAVAATSIPAAVATTSTPAAETSSWEMNMQTFETLSSEIGTMVKHLSANERESSSAYLRDQLVILHSLISNKLATQQV